MDISRPPPRLADILVKYVFELRKTCPHLALVKKGFTGVLSLYGLDVFMHGRLKILHFKAFRK